MSERKSFYLGVCEADPRFLRQNFVERGSSATSTAAKQPLPRQSRPSIFHSVEELAKGDCASAFQTPLRIVTSEAQNPAPPHFALPTPPQAAHSLNAECRRQLSAEDLVRNEKPSSNYSNAWSGVTSQQRSASSSSSSDFAAALTLTSNPTLSRLAFDSVRPYCSPSSASTTNALQDRQRISKPTHQVKARVN